MPNITMPQHLTAKSESRFLIIGQGKLGGLVTKALADLEYQVTGVARQPRQTYDLPDGVDFIQADARALLAEQIAGTTHIAIILTADAYTPEGYQDTYLAVCEHLVTLANTSEALTQLQRIVFISSTGVYGQDSGEWVDVHTPPLAPNRPRLEMILAAEACLQDGFGECCSIIRASGIYGKERQGRIQAAQKQLDEQYTQSHSHSALRSSVGAAPDKHWTNRIMDSDLLNVIVQVLTAEHALPLYLATDYCPVTSTEMSDWLCATLAQQQASLQNASMQQNKNCEFSDEAQSLASNKQNEPKVTGKRLHSNIPRAWLAYPDWQVGYEAILSYNEQKASQ